MEVKLRPRPLHPGLVQAKASAPARPTLHELLLEAKPSWSEQDRKAAERKLAKLGVHTASDLANALPEINGRLQAAGLQRFSCETMAAFNRCLTAQQGLKAPAAKAKPGGGSAAASGADQWEGWRVVELKAQVRVEVREVAAGVGAESSDEEQEQEDEEEEEQRLSQEELTKLCLAKGVTLSQLQKPRKAKELLRRIERLERSPASTITNEYKARGYAPEAGLRKEALLARTKEAIIWERLSLEPLRQVCLDHSLPADTASSRGELLQLLTDASWAARGVPLARLPNLVVAHGVLDSVQALESKGLPDLVAQARKLGVPLEAKPEREDLLPRLRAALLWRQMEPPELRADCVARGCPVPDVAPDAAAPPHKWHPGRLSKDGTERQALEKLLLQSLWLDVWAAAGVPLCLLGGHAAAAGVFRGVERLREMGSEQLKQAYAKLELPLSNSSDRRFVLGRLAESLVWKELLLEKLREECAARGLQPPAAGAEGEEAERKALTRMLQWGACTRAWEAKGIPVLRLGGAEQAAAVAQEWEGLDMATEQDLKIRCELQGLPLEASLERGELMGLLRDAAVWEALPLAELRTEAAAQLGALGNAAGDGWAEQCQLVEKLLLHRCAGTYEARGIPARRLASLKAAAKLSADWSALDAMDMHRLTEDCERMGFPAQGLRRQDLLPVMRDVALWQVLPLEDLRLTCRAEGMPLPEVVRGEEEEERGHLVDSLLVARCEAFFERRGVPVRRLGSVRAAASVATLWQRLEALAFSELAARARERGLHVEPELTQVELLERLRTATLWAELPLRELQKECRFYGVNSIPVSFKATSVGIKLDGIAGGVQVSERRELCQRLVAELWGPPPPEPPPPPQPPPLPPRRSAPPPRQAPPPRKMPAPPAAVNRHLKTLGLPARASVQEIRKAYKRLALKYHPDKNLEASQEEASKRFREVAEAYAALCK